MDIQPEDMRSGGTDKYTLFQGQADPCCPQCGCLICACGSD